MNPNDAVVPDGNAHKIVPNPIVPIEERKPGVRYNKSGRARYAANTRLNICTLERMRPLYIDAEGYALPPPTYNPTQKARWGEPKRMVHFLWMYNYSCGNMMMSCQYANINRAKFSLWLKSNKQFAKKLEEIKDEIVDRAMFKYWVALGMIRRPNGTKPITLNANALREAIRGLKPELFKDEVEEDVKRQREPEIRDNIPRPSWPETEMEHAEGQAE